MTLREIRQAWPGLFYDQTWFDGEVFLDGEATRLPTPAFFPAYRPPRKNLPNAATLALAYVNDPDAPVWARYLWTSDVDRLGQRVYVGGVGRSQSGRFEIHRHLNVDSNWGIPKWS